MKRTILDLHSVD